MASPPVLALSDVALSIGAGNLLDGASLSVSPGDRLCLVGRNGSGKSTLMRVASGRLAIDRGVRFLQPGASLGELVQDPVFDGFDTVADYVLHRPAASGGAAGDDRDDNRREAEARGMLDELGLDAAQPVGTLSGGQGKRAALVRALAASPDILLLDEPTNHLDLPGIEWLERHLAASRAGLVLISHDRRLLERVATGVVWLDRGVTRRLDAGFARFEAWRDDILEKQEAEGHKLDRQIAREEDWMRYGVTARRKRNVRRVAELAGLRRQRTESLRDASALRLDAAGAGMSGRLVAVAEGAGKSWPTPDGGARAVVSGLDLRVLRRDRLGIVGANGAGKTTLLNLLTGALAPDSGRIALGASLATATLDQQRRTLDPDATLADTLTGGGGDTVSIGGERRHVIGVMKDFLFRPEQARTPVGILSGGERGRLALACALIRPSNLLVLDEPTNDLDLETLDLLEELLSSYAGTLILVSHDRDFLDRVATSVLVAEGGGAWLEYAGGWSDMLAQRGGSPFAPARPVANGRRGDPAREGGGARPATGKLTFKDSEALRTLPATIASLEAELAVLDRTLADGGLFNRDRAKFEAATARHHAARSALDAAEERWLELEMRRDENERARGRA